MSKRVNGKKGNRVSKHKRGSTSHCTKVRGCASGKWFTHQSTLAELKKQADASLAL